MRRRSPTWNAGLKNSKGIKTITIEPGAARAFPAAPIGMGDTMSPAMSTTAAALTYPHITRDPAIRGGQSRLDGSRIAVTDIVAAEQDGHRPEEIRTLFGASLTLAQVYAALAYYYDHPAEIEEEFRMQAESFAQGEAARSLFLKARG